MTHSKAIAVLAKIDQSTVIDSNWWSCFTDNMDIPTAIFKLAGLNNWDSVLRRYEGYTVLRFLEEFEIEKETLTIHDLKGTFELTDSEGNIVKDWLEDYEACLAWAVENGYTSWFKNPIDPIDQAMEILRNAGYFGITWTLSDIIERAKSDGYQIDESQAREIADSIENNHDASIGIDWDNISFHIGEFAEENSLEELEELDEND